MSDTHTTPRTAAFIGLGVMGYPMAGHLKRAGLEVRVYNRTRARAEQWSEEYGGSHHATPREAAEGADIVLMCVGNDDDVRSVTYGDDGVLAGMASGSLLVDHTTASADLARELAAAPCCGMCCRDTCASARDRAADGDVDRISVGRRSSLEPLGLFRSKASPPRS